VLVRAPAPEEITDALDAFAALLGKPEEEVAADATPTLVKLLRESADRLAAEWGQKLAEIPVHLIEEPAFRLAGAEEAIRHAVATIEQVLQHHEPLSQELAANAAEAHTRLQLLAAPAKPGVRRPACSPVEVVELLRAYPKWRYQALVLHHLAEAFVSLRGHLSDELREVNFCRVRLSELLRLLEEAPAEEAALPVGRSAGPGERQGSIGRRLFLSGCKDLSEAVQQFLAGLSPDDLLELDAWMEETLKKDFTALVHVCLSSGTILKGVGAAMLETARAFAATKLPATDVAELFFEQQPEEEEAQAEAVTFFDEAAPELTTSRTAARSTPAAELCVLGTPPGEASERFRALLCQALPEVEVQHAIGPDDILLYRERSNLALTDLEQMGPVAQRAYAQLGATENFTPHSRIDVEFKPHRTA
jgi:hypothetical protein